jgi:CRP-like cAMP-binding protein
MHKELHANFFGLADKGLINFFDKKQRSHFYQKKQVLVYEGSPAIGIYCVHSGRVKVYKIGHEGKQHILRIANPGSILGLEAILASDHYTSNLEMIEDGVVCFIDKETLFDSLKQNPPLAFKIMGILSKDLLSSEEERAELAQASVRERMARLLTILTNSHGIRVNNGICIDLHLTREEMAEMIGTAAETAMRLLKEFKDEKMVEVEGKNIIILDKKRLVESAHLLEESV